MLHYETVEPHTLELLNSLMKISIFENLRLVGGTSLSLQIGHRKSIDLDLFGKADLTEIDISKAISPLGEVKLLKKTPNIYIYLINGIKVDFVNYPYPWLENQILFDGIRLATKKDIAAMKLSAIAGRGTKKDFVDLFYLLKDYTLADLLSSFKQKYHDGSEFLVLKSLTYFEDANDGEIEMFDNYGWKKIKQFIIKSHQSYLDSLL